MTMNVLGKVAGSLNDKSARKWAKNDKVIEAGARGEARTADALLNGRDGTIMHDMRIPGERANIDHIVVSGNKVWLIDSKWWKGGRYMTVFGKTYRGFTRVPHTEKDTMARAYEKVERHLHEKGVDFDLQTPIIVVWSHEPLKLGLAKIPGARLIAGGSFRGQARKLFKADANNEIIDALRELVI
jgi:hypothetical protein